MARTRSAASPSMVDVARAAGVSPQTVSRVVNGEPSVIPETRNKVLEAIKRLGYRPNAAARAMKRGSFHAIGVAYHSLRSAGTQLPVEEISRQAAQRGYATLLLPLDVPSSLNADGAISHLEEMATDAVIAIMPNLFEGPARPRPFGSPPILTVASSSAPGIASIDFDHKDGSKQAVDHLLDLGHITVDHIAGPTSAPDAVLRLQGWQEALRAANRHVPEPAYGTWMPESGYQAAKELLSRRRLPTAIYVANDRMALGAYRAVTEEGLRVPEDVSIVGFDDLDEAAIYAPPLTTIAQDFARFGREALDMTFDMIEGGEPTNRIVPVSLVRRESTAAPRRS